MEKGIERLLCPPYLNGTNNTTITTTAEKKSVIRTKPEHRHKHVTNVLKCESVTITF